MRTDPACHALHRVYNQSLPGPHSCGTGRERFEVLLELKPTILVSGFGPFPGVETNPTASLVARLHGQTLADHRVVGATLDVRFQDAALQLLALAETIKPAAVLMTGVATGARRIRIEQCASNRVASGRRDAAGATGSLWANHDAGETLQTSASPNGLVDALRRGGHDAAVSSDAGSYVCNHTYFQILAALAQGATPIPCVFMHIPPVGGKSPRGDTWTHVTFEDAAQLVLAALVEQSAG